MNKFKFLAVLVVLALIGSAYFYLTGTYSDGFRAGTVMKLSSKGYIFKTMEGELNLGMIVNPDPNAPASTNNVWDFSVREKDKDVIQALEDAMTTGHRVRLHYKEKYRALPWMGETPYFIYKVESAP